MAVVPNIHYINYQLYNQLIDLDFLSIIEIGNYVREDGYLNIIYFFWKYPDEYIEEGLKSLHTKKQLLQIYLKWQHLGKHTLHIFVEYGMDEMDVVVEEKDGIIKKGDGIVSEGDEFNVEGRNAT